MARKTATTFICNRCKREVTQPTEPAPRDGWWEVYTRNAAVSGGASSPSFYADLCPICVGELQKFMAGAGVEKPQEGQPAEWVTCIKDSQPHRRGTQCIQPHPVSKPGQRVEEWAWVKCSRDSRVHLRNLHCADPFPATERNRPVLKERAHDT